MNPESVKEEESVAMAAEDKDEDDVMISEVKGEDNVMVDKEEGETSISLPALKGEFGMNQRTGVVQATSLEPFVVMQTFRLGMMSLGKVPLSPHRCRPCCMCLVPVSHTDWGSDSGLKLIPGMNYNPCLAWNGILYLWVAPHPSPFRYHQLYPDPIPDLRDARIETKKYFFYDFHSSVFRGS